MSLIDTDYRYCDHTMYLSHTIEIPSDSPQLWLSNRVYLQRVSIRLGRAQFCIGWRARVCAPTARNMC
ncbi:hypothetical protein C2E23DRAFT_843901, partial [Lenzites betulinus]